MTALVQRFSKTYPTGNTTTTDHTYTIPSVANQSISATEPDACPITLTRGGVVKNFSIYGSQGAPSSGPCHILAGYYDDLAGSPNHFHGASPQHFIPAGFFGKITFVIPPSMYNAAGSQVWAVIWYDNSYVLNLLDLNAPINKVRPANPWTFPTWHDPFGPTLPFPNANLMLDAVSTQGGSGPLLKPRYGVI